MTYQKHKMAKAYIALSNIPTADQVNAISHRLGHFVEQMRQRVEASRNTNVLSWEQLAKISPVPIVVDEQPTLDHLHAQMVPACFVLLRLLKQ